MTNYDSPLKPHRLASLGCFLQDASWSHEGLTPEWHPRCGRIVRLSVRTFCFLKFEYQRANIEFKFLFFSLCTVAKVYAQHSLGAASFTDKSSKFVIGFIKTDFRKVYGSWVKVRSSKILQNFSKKFFEKNFFENFLKKKNFEKIVMWHIKLKLRLYWIEWW